ncbi:MAG: shikimate kinase [Clostridia bacterium]|nr:shikimate kinase [Clostridia bacterium]
MKNLVLIGMPGCGKSTVGVLLAKALGYDFLDTDLVIQRREGKRLQEIIDGEGLDAFLAAEAAALRSVEATHTVIATGGSAVYSPEGMAHLARRGVIVWLRVDLPTLKARLGDFAARGIAGVGAKTLDDIFAEREPLYARYAQITVNCAGGIAGVEQTKQRVLEILAGHSLMLQSNEQE